MAASGAGSFNERQGLSGQEGVAATGKTERAGKEPDNQKCTACRDGKKADRPGRYAGIAGEISTGEKQRSARQNRGVGGERNEFRVFEKVPW